MAAPAVILADTTTGNPEVSAALQRIKELLQQRRPDLPIELAELGAKSTLEPALKSLKKAEVEEAVFVPLDLRSATAYPPEFDDATAVAEKHGIMSVVSRPIGPATELLNILDELVREALQARSALELDGLVLVARSGGDARGSALLSRRARQWSAHHRLPVQLAIEEGDGKATAAAVQALRAQGRRYVAVGGTFLAPGPAYRAHALAAQQAGAIAVTQPIGGSPHLSQLILARYAFGAMELLDGHPQPVVVDADYTFLSTRKR
ncbi:MAG: hypothetical protein GX596_09225 [Propionibacterium sp.]|nr:hypothetical protein [Propionibacterium sp.]